MTKIQSQTGKNIESIKKRLEKEQQKARRKFKTSFPEAEDFLKNRGLEVEKIRERSAELVSLGALSASVMLTSPSQNLDLPLPQEIIKKLKREDAAPDLKAQNFVKDALKSILPQPPRPLSQEEENYLENLLGKIFSLNIHAALDGNHLNTTYGYIGAEQHLPRFPGDTAGQHTITKAGITPSTGAWGYFAPSKDKLTPELEETERWYAVAQTMYLPEWNTRTSELREWYKHRKVIIINKENGKAVLAAIADAGPAAWTGKQFGGSPEVMQSLGGPKYKIGPVLVFFVSDPEDKAKLGPIEYNQDLISSFSLQTIYE